jgi:AcrR family transcriptional regulator
MGARAEAAAETGRGIIRAAISLGPELLTGGATLEDVAARSGVTVQTVIRRFGSKEDLIVAAAEEARADVRAQRGAAPVGDIAGAVENLIDHYEEWGDIQAELVAQEDRFPAIRRITDPGRELHREWVEHTFGPFLEGWEGQDRERRLVEFIVLTDLMVWKLVRRDLGLSRDQTSLAIRELLTALKGDG